MAITNPYAVHPGKDGESIEMDSSAYQRILSCLTGIRRVGKRFEKTCGRMVCHGILVTLSARKTCPGPVFSEGRSGKFVEKGFHKQIWIASC